MLTNWSTMMVQTGFGLHHAHTQLQMYVLMHEAYETMCVTHTLILA